MPFLANINTPLKIFLVGLSMFTPVIVGAAAVQSTSPEVFQDVDQGYWQVSIQCEGIETQKSMRRRIDQDQWCSTTEPNVCDDDKFSLSQRLCSDNFGTSTNNVNNSNSALVDQNKQSAIGAGTSVSKNTVDVISSLGGNTEVISVKQMSREDLLKEQMLIEEQRILVKQKQLELRRRELSLQKRRLTTPY